MEQVEQSVNSLTSQIGLSAGMLTLHSLVPAAVLLIVCLFVIKAILKIVDSILSRDKIDKSLNVFIRSSIKYILLFLTILIVAATMGINITSLVAVFSILGLAISLAVQGALSNIAGGFIILVSKPFKVDDYVDVGGVEGTIKEIGLIYTKLLTLDGKLIHVPNGDISSSRITNFTYEGVRKVNLHFTASYDSPVETVYKALREAVKATPGFFKEEEPLIQVTNYLESSIEYLVRAGLKAEDYWPAYFALMENVKYSFDENGVEMTYNHINVHMMK